MKRIAALLLALVLALSVTACSGSNGTTTTDTATEPVETQTPEEVSNAAQEITEAKEYRSVYRTSFSSSYASFNYFSTAYATVRSIVSNCIDGLVEPDIYGVYVPSLAESWTTNEDETVWTFKIREGLKWVPYRRRYRP